MSHFITFVLVPKNIGGEEEILGEVSRLLEPYNENKEVEPYLTKCHCVNFKVTVESRERVEKEMPIQHFRDEFRLIVDKNFPSRTPFDEEV